ncbi:MAG: DUF1467 family protein [Hyphomicrobiales bacterium]
MNLALGIAIFIVIWWTVLFAILPLWVRTQGEEGEVVSGTPASAPVNHRLVAKFAVTTLVSLLIFGAFYAVMEYKLISLDDIPLLPRFEHTPPRT